MARAALLCQSIVIRQAVTLVWRAPWLSDILGEGNNEGDSMTVIFVDPKFYDVIKEGLPQAWRDLATDVGEVADSARSERPVCRDTASRALESLEAEAQQRISAARDRQGLGGLHGNGILWVPGLVAIEDLAALLRAALASETETALCPECNREADGLDGNHCQEHWEALCGKAWWDTMA